MMTIETARLIMRPILSSDTEDFHQLCLDPQVRKYLLDDEIVSCEWAEAEVTRSIKSFEKEGFGLWTIALGAEEPLIGFSGYRYYHEPPELQLIYGLHPDHWNKGLVTEAARALIRFGFEHLGFERVIAAADVPNKASFRVMEMAGMKYDKRVMAEGLDTIYYGVNRDDYHTHDEPYRVSPP